MGKGKGKGQPNTVPKVEFDLEHDWKDPVKLRASKETVETRIQQLKTVMRQGGDKNSFDQAQLLLHGYLAIEKVMNRANRKIA